MRRSPVKMHKVQRMRSRVSKSLNIIHQLKINCDSSLKQLLIWSGIHRFSISNILPYIHLTKIHQNLLLFKKINRCSLLILCIKLQQWKIHWIKYFKVRSRQKKFLIVYFIRKKRILVRKISLNSLLLKDTIKNRTFLIF